LRLIGDVARDIDGARQGRGNALAGFGLNR